MSRVITVTQDTWEQQVTRSSVPVLVDFWAPWCQPCRRLAPTLEELAEEVGDNAVIAKVNVDEERSLAAVWQIMSIPALMFFSSGQKVSEIIGGTTKEALVQGLRDAGAVI